MHLLINYMLITYFSFFKHVFVELFFCARHSLEHRDKAAINPVFKQLIPNNMHNSYFISFFYLIQNRISKIYLVVTGTFIKLWFPILFLPHNWIALFPLSTIWSVYGNSIIYYMLPLKFRNLNDSRNKSQLAISPAKVKWKKNALVKKDFFF